MCPLFANPQMLSINKQFNLSLITNFIFTLGKAVLFRAGSRSDGLARQCWALLPCSVMQHGWALHSWSPGLGTYPNAASKSNKCLEQSLLLCFHVLLGSSLARLSLCHRIMNARRAVSQAG